MSYFNLKALITLSKVTDVNMSSYFVKVSIIVNKLTYEYAKIFCRNPDLHKPIKWKPADFETGADYSYRKALEAYGGFKVLLHDLLSLVLDGGEWSALNRCRFTSGKVIHFIHYARKVLGR
jgi:hypothetical protein